MGTKLEELLAMALPSPSFVRPCNGGSLLALALHCMMVEGGFIALDYKERPQLLSAAQHRPPAGWNSQPNEWMFFYARRGAANRFCLHVACMPANGRVFVHGSELPWGKEEPLEGRIAVLGLQLDNYVPDSAAAGAQKGWQGVIAQQDKLREFFGQHVLDPLQQGVEPLPDGPDGLPHTLRTLPVRLQEAAAWAACGTRCAALRARSWAVAQWREAAAGWETVLVAGGVVLTAIGVGVVALRARAVAR